MSDNNRDYQLISDSELQLMMEYRVIGERPGYHHAKGVVRYVWDYLGIANDIPIVYGAPEGRLTVRGMDVPGCFCPSENSIVLAFGSATVGTVLHEVAHAIQTIVEPESPAHGVIFRGIMCYVVAAFTDDCIGERLRQLYKLHSEGTSE